MLDKSHILIPEDQCTASGWFSGVIKFICQFDNNWTQQLRPGNAINMTVPIHRYSADYYEFLLHAGESGCKFYAPLLRHRYFSISVMEQQCEKWGSESPWIYQAFAELEDEYQSSCLTFDDNNMNVCCTSKYPEHPIASDFRHCFCCSAFLDFGIRQFSQRIGFAVDGSPASYDEAQTSNMIDLLKAQGFVKQWFSTELNQIWINRKVCCVISRELIASSHNDTLHISFYYNNEEECRDIVCFLRSTGWEEDDFFRSFPQWPAPMRGGPEPG